MSGGRLGRLCGVLAVYVACGAIASAADGTSIDYLRDVKPVLARRCYACHGALAQKAHLRVDTAASMRKGGDGGPVIEPGRADESALIERVSETDPKLRMPPEGPALTAGEIARIRTWIDAGALAPGDEQPERGPTEHWAFRKPVRPGVPSVKDPAWVRNPIDAFIAAARDREGLKPVPPSPPDVLLRRVSLDLIGLPPTREELNEFLRDPSEEAYARAVERLLASPRYGERWARHWMDIWRYSDWYGRRAVPDVTNSYAMIWRWRDWIVRSLNADRGYDRMVALMLAADELTPSDDSEIVATGYILRNFYRWNYNTWMKDNVEHTAKAFLGLTLQCAHCHDHKYDPLTQKDYFAFRAFFEPLEVRHDRVPGEPDPGPYPKYTYGASYAPITSGMTRVFDEKLDAKTFLYTRGESRNVIPGRPPVEPSVPAFLRPQSFHVSEVGLPREAGYPGLKPWIIRDEVTKAEYALAAAEAERDKALKMADAARAAHDAALQAAANRNNPPVFVGDDQIRAFVPSGPIETPEIRTAADARESADAMHQVATRQVELARSRLTALRARIAADRVCRGGEPGDAKQLARAATRAERTAAAEQARADLARAAHTLIVAQQKARKNPAAGPEVVAASQKRDAAMANFKTAEAAITKESEAYTPLSPVYPARSTGRRSALAAWITSRENPLTARVAANHLWRWHFHRPIVPTTHDFGRNGKPPTHPELLDWLAVELMAPSSPGAAPWSFKHLHRLIVTSATYRMSSRPEQGSARDRSADTADRGLWCFPSARVEAEALRDSLLHVAGVLDTTMGGPDINQTDGLTSHRRSLYFTHHGESRMPFLELFDAPDPCDAYVRTVSVVPQQALALTNNELARSLAQSLAARLWAEASRQTGCSPPASFVELAFAQVLSRAPRPAERTVALEFLARAASESPAVAIEAREDFIHVLFNHHDFLTIH